MGNDWGELEKSEEEESKSPYIKQIEEIKPEIEKEIKEALSMAL